MILATPHFGSKTTKPKVLHESIFALSEYKNHCNLMHIFPLRCIMDSDNQPATITQVLS